VVGKESNSIIILSQEVRVCVVVLLAERSQEHIIGTHYTLANLAWVKTHLHENVAETALILGELGVLPQKDLSIMGVVLVMVIIEVEAVEDIHKPSQEVENDTVPGYPIDQLIEFIEHHSVQ